MKRIVFLVLTSILVSCGSNKNINMKELVVKDLDLSKYQGTWYEIERIPVKQEKNLHNVTATYTIEENGKVKVVNTGYTPDNERKTATGKAWVPDKNIPAILKVTFFWPFTGDYNVLYIDNLYTNALVSSSNGKYAWILSRSAQMLDEKINELKQIAAQKGVDISKFEVVKQSW